MEVAEEYERRRTPPAGQQGWSEAHLTLGITPTASLLIWAAVHQRPPKPQAPHAEQICVVWPHASAPPHTDVPPHADVPPHSGLPVVMAEAEIPIPTDRWELRTSGLWAEQVCERPHDHWSFGLEAFALELDHATELTRTGYGTRVPLGWELDFEASEPAQWLLTDSAPLELAGAYTQPGKLHGLLLDADGEHATEGIAQRWHWWGTKPLTSAGLGRSQGGDDEVLQIPTSIGLYTIERTPTSLSIAASPELHAPNLLL